MCRQNYTHTHTHTHWRWVERGVVICSNSQLTLFILCSSVWAEPTILHIDEPGGVYQSLYLHGYTQTHTHTDTQTHTHTLKSREWRQFRAFWLLFFSFCVFLFLLTFVIWTVGWFRVKMAGRGRLRRRECTERAGREEERLFWSLWTVITTYSCFLPGALTGHQQRGGGNWSRENRKRSLLSRGTRKTHVAEVLAFVLFIISQHFHLSLHN